MSFIEDVKRKAKAKKRTIVLPEAEDKRTLEAAMQIKKDLQILCFSVIRKR